MQPFQPLPLPTTSKHSRTSLFLLWNLLLFPKCVYPGNSYPTLHDQHHLLLSTHYLFLSFSSFPYLHYLYFTPILVDTQLMCTFHLLCSMTKLKEHSRAICCSNFCYLHYPACHRLPSHQRCLTSPRWPHVHHIFLPESTPLFKTKKSPSEWESEGIRPPKTDAILNIYSIYMYIYSAKGAHTHQSLCGKLQFNLGRSLAKSVMCNHTCGAKVNFSILIQKNTIVAD